MANVNTFSIVKNVKLDLGIEDDNQDQLLEMLLNRITDHFKANYGVLEIDNAFSFVLEDCLIARFNRRGSERAKTEEVEGHKTTYYDHLNEFEPYYAMIMAKLNLIKDKSRKGGLYFL
ncbi:phage protein [Streptococcus pyogenes]|uniref:phage head-tail connector protein n=1 Tax=Streptococcus pyogenes TaxID=1314 RepID=UPI0010A1847B|nr:phage head-tail connector protein [Streptococcus pyogenes]VHF12678.1 phage protein [Streptococcus pyogenes]VHM84770.1 phage protein [Streptococcus pyogenes]HER6178863.1 phage head-tail connector protein [Streptococcus pyogenes]HER6181995.1 phage head-tail connector protein [Streptococcus pyogenes]HER6194035.1 phage head-tail connector protein [Streptococcus pyogenes]